ncbi:hypothetical protein OJ967_27860 (plasmid) [Peribacillus frigoritolerans]|uniref:hypothetical protein n=1 Tax=Peribacillus frigoritolerans TaxID=450367 RepID=UPI002227CCA5|nr:hypothetical protein [Peribacillus frigoritolerans]UYZ01849.1 hypothetical protein OJ967_27860 [Peribacillus frigoritolerans]
MQKGKTNAAPALVIRLLNKSLPHFVEVIKAFMDNSLAMHKLVKGGKQSQVLTSKVKLVVFTHVLEPVTVASIVFTNFVKICGRSGGVEEMELINQVIESVQSHLKYFDISLSKNIPDYIHDMWNRQKDEILILTGIEKVEIGQALVDMCLNACEELFKKESVMVSSDERVNYIRIQNNFLQDLSELAFNPIRLPMIHKPNE